MSRSFEALTVASVLEEVLSNNGNTKEWLNHMTGGKGIRKMDRKVDTKLEAEVDTELEVDVHGNGNIQSSKDGDNNEQQSTCTPNISFPNYFSHYEPLAHPQHRQSEQRYSQQIHPSNPASETVNSNPSFEMFDMDDLVEKTVQALYLFEADRKEVMNDPLTRLLLRERPRNINCRIVSAMGVVSDGAKGQELESTFKMLKEKWNIDLIRADTGIGRSLEYNAGRIADAIRNLKDGPWCWLGYSQGCANALMAESMLLTGTPTEHALIKNKLKSRCLLFGAHNGSVHGSLADTKIENAIVDVEYFLKLLQAHFSFSFTSCILSRVTSILVSRAASNLFAGIRSLTHSGLIRLWRDGQFEPNCHTIALRAAVEPDFTQPEVLDLASEMLSSQTTTRELHDTQVTIGECVGSAILVRNSQTEEYSNSCVDSKVQRSHHWSPLRKEAEFLESERDQRRHVYDTPKYRHVEPWIENLIRFGIIQ